MSNSLNLSLIEGRLTRDPELVWTKNGAAVCKFDIAVNFTYKSDGKNVDEVSFISVNTWNKIAEVCSQYLKKGSKIRVKGRIKQDIWTDNNGAKKSKIYIEASSVDFLQEPSKKEVQKEEAVV